MSDLDALLEANPAPVETAQTVVSGGYRCRHPKSQRVHVVNMAGRPEDVCGLCGVVISWEKAMKGRQSRNYGNRAELAVARAYGGQKVGHHGGPVDVRGADFNTQVKTHRRLPPVEWTKVFAALGASTDRLPRLLLRFVHTAGPTDYFVVPAKVWLEWFGKDEAA